MGLGRWKFPKKNSHNNIVMGFPLCSVYPVTFRSPSFFSKAQVSGKWGREKPQNVGCAYFICIKLWAAQNCGIFSAADSAPINVYKTLPKKLYRTHENTLQLETDRPEKNSNRVERLEAYNQLLGIRNFFAIQRPLRAIPLEIFRNINFRFPCHLFSIQGAQVLLYMMVKLNNKEQFFLYHRYDRVLKRIFWIEWHFYIS